MQNWNHEPFFTEISKDSDKKTSESYLADIGPKHVMKSCFNSVFKAWFHKKIEGRHPSFFPKFLFRIRWKF